MGKRLLAIFNTADDAVAAANELRREGFGKASGKGSVAVMSAEPIHTEIEKELEGSRSSMGYFAIAGGVIGAAGAVLLTALTSKQMNLITGGMPVVAPWAFGIVVFEMTALGAILANLFRMILEARLVRRGLPEKCDNAVADGKAVVAVDMDSSDSRAGAVEALLARRGAEVL